VSEPIATDAELAMLRRHGVKSFKANGIEVVFFEPRADMPDTPKVAEGCRCGHAWHEHGAQGDCLKGCDPTSCAEGLK
jgi:hypothetical protein